MGINGPMFYYFMPIFLAMVAAEIVVGRRRGLVLYTKDETLASIGIQIGQRVIGLVGFGVATIFWSIAYENRLFDLTMNAATIALLFILLEFTYYWYHRASHEVRWFWATHAVHHSIEEMNILASYRPGWTSKISGAAILHTPLLWLGFSAVEVSTMLALNLFYQSWLHTTLIGRLGPLEGVLNTPSAHRVHHARNADYLDRNHGGVTVIFDRIFGTYVAGRDDEPVEFGLVKPAGSTNPVLLAFHEWARMVRDVKRSHPRDWPGYLFGPPGWAPNGKGATSAVLRARYRAERRTGDGVPFAVPAE